MIPNRNNPWKSYHSVATQTASPGQLVLMLFDGAIRFLETARQGFLENDPSERNRLINHNVQRAQAIITELNVSLNLREGGDLATTLRGLYEYFDSRLLEANVKKDETGIIEVIDRMSVLRNAWAEMLTNQAQPGVAAADRGALCVLS